VRAWPGKGFVEGMVPYSKEIVDHLWKFNWNAGRVPW